MKLHDLSPAEGSRKDSIRRGRGGASRRGEKAGRGTKGQKKRNQVPVYFEGGQTPLYRRLPKRGFNPVDRTEYQVVNISQLNQFDDGDEISIEDLSEQGFVKEDQPVKLLGDGELEIESLTIHVDAVSRSARQQLEDASGIVELRSEPGA